MPYVTSSMVITAKSDFVPPSPASPPPPPPPPPSAPGTSSGLPSGLTAINVTNDAQLANAIASWSPGKEIVLADGTYTGNYTISGNGTESQPFLVRALNKGNATLNGTLSLAGSHPFAWGLRINNLVDVQGTNPKLVRCWIDHDAGQYDAAVLVHNATDALIAFNDLTGIGQLVELRPDHNDPPGLLRPVVRRNKFHDVDFGDVVNGYDGLLLGNQWRHTGIEMQAVVEYCLFDNVAIDSEAISNKSTGNILRFLHFKNGSLQLSMRHGESCDLEGITVDGGPGFTIFDRGHRVRGCQAINGARFRLGAGTRTPDQWDASPPDPGPDYPAATDVRLYGCKGPVEVGGQAGFLNGADDVPARDCRLEAHEGSISYDRHTGTVVENVTYETVPVPVILTDADVGPNADGSVTSPDNEPSPPPATTGTYAHAPPARSSIVDVVTITDPNARYLLNDLPTKNDQFGSIGGNFLTGNATTDLLLVMPNEEFHGQVHIWGYKNIYIIGGRLRPYPIVNATTHAGQSYRGVGALFRIHTHPNAVDPKVYVAGLDIVNDPYKNGSDEGLAFGDVFAYGGTTSNENNWPTVYFQNIRIGDIPGWTNSVNNPDTYVTKTDLIKADGGGFKETYIDNCDWSLAYQVYTGLTWAYDKPHSTLGHAFLSNTQLRPVRLSGFPYTHIKMFMAFGSIPADEGDYNEVFVDNVWIGDHPVAGKNADELFHPTNGVYQANLDGDDLTWPSRIGAGRDAPLVTGTIKVGISPVSMIDENVIGLPARITSVAALDALIAS